MEEGRGVGCAQGTNVWVRVPASRQDTGFDKRSALHWASEKGLAGTVAQLLALGADATLTDKVRASSEYRYPSTCIDQYTYKHKYTSVRYGMETRALVSGQFLDRQRQHWPSADKLRSRLWTLEGLVRFRICIHIVCLSVCVCVCVCTCVMYLDVVACVCACMQGEGIYADRVRASEVGHR